ncbi:30S ribosomal protein S11 [Patescibacteria group bacterium]|nr:30S ribosomal protein S11 [Patescibacteria group bacterium]MBU4367907.1 30S ribosomal protein S11 [Patescibacteria group bacterium]MBU4461916.1 30S ribosomal protein S11 [Patescibacteria group bacterium]MCG2699859.1 30S ribosomal protein S11 [Candidatus Parcubacteria bacterium]
MGKKHVIKKSEEEVIKETDKIEAGLKKEPKIKATAQRISEAKVYISSSYNNTIITLTDLIGKALTWKSAGSVGFKGTKKGTAFAASKVGETISNIILKMGIEKIHVFVKGIGPGRDSAVRSLMTHGLNIITIKDITPIPHNGCRPRKTRRV